VEVGFEKAGEMALVTETQVSSYFCKTQTCGGQQFRSSFNAPLANIRARWQSEMMREANGEMGAVNAQRGGKLGN